MDFDRYFTVNEQDLHNASNSNGDWEHSDEQTARLQIRLEDSLIDHISTSPPTRQRPQVEAKPLPPVPEEPEAASLPMPTSQIAAPYSRPPKAPTTRIPGIDGRQRSPRRGSASSSECSPTQRTDQHLSLWPKTYPVDVRKPSRICTTTFQRNIDGSSYHPDFDSPHSQESCDLEQWATEIYGPQDCAMTSLRDKRRGVSSKSSLVAQHKEQMPPVKKSPILKSYADSAYCSSTSASSTDNERSTSPTSPSDTPTSDFERGKPGDPTPASFFEDEGRPPAKKFWRKMASSLRPIKSKANLRGSDASPNGMPMISA
ncbi:hypothetical protein MBLNU13_g05854t1 [Cladosporium sp. NU13]